MKAAVLVMACARWDAHSADSQTYLLQPHSRPADCSVAALFIRELARNFSIWFKPHVTLFSR